MNNGLNHFKQYIYGMEEKCYLSPQLLKALGHRENNPQDEIEKSEVFSLGLCVLEMALMKSI